MKLIQMTKLQILFRTAFILPNRTQVYVQLYQFLSIFVFWEDYASIFPKIISKNYDMLYYSFK